MILLLYSGMTYHVGGIQLHPSVVIFFFFWFRLMWKGHDLCLHNGHVPGFNLKVGSN